jgi:DNA-directed RNA polymerase subunit K/omega
MIDRSKLTNSFEFVVMAGARARQLLAGSTPRVAVGEHKKTTVAQQEVATRVVEKIEHAPKVTAERSPITGVSE